MAEIRPLNVLTLLKTIHCFTQAETGAAEPYLWTVIFKIDGDTAYIDEEFRLQGRATVIRTPDNRGQLSDRSVSDGDTVQIPAEYGEFQTILKPIPLMTPLFGQTHYGGYIGCVVVLMEKDGSPPSAMTSGYDALVNTLQLALDMIIPTLNYENTEPAPELIESLGVIIKTTVEETVKSHHNIFDLFRNPDDSIGFAFFRHSYNELVDAGSTGILLSERWQPEPGEDEVEATLKGDWSVSGVMAATQSTPRPDLMISPVALNLGDVIRDLITRRDQAFTISSGNSGGAIEIVNISIEGQDAANFSLATNTAHVLPKTLQPGESFSLDLLFQSGRLGQHLARVAVTGLVPPTGEPLSIFSQITANSVAPIINVMPQSINFGNQYLGTITVRNMLIENLGYTELSWRITPAVQGQFKWSVSLSNIWQKLAPGTNQVVEIQFEPTSFGSHSDQITIENNDRPIVVPLVGIGITRS